MGIRVLSVFSVMRTNKYHIDCEGEPCLWWWQPWLPHLQLLHWAVSSGTVSEIPDLWAVAGGCQWKEKMSREIFLFYPPVPKLVAFFFFSSHLFWPNFRTPEQGSQMVGEMGKIRSHVNCLSCCPCSGEPLMPPGQRMPLSPHTCRRIFIFMHI